jgi:periplasmic mercuric ion binding protein
MKKMKLFSLVALSLALATVATAQTKTETFKVSGNCSMCKSKIEKAAKEAGAKTASWDADSKIITVSYKSSSTNTAKMQEQIALVGYDNAGAKATNEAYDKLHGCCKYERSTSETSEAKASCCKGAATCNHHEGEGKDHEATMDCCKDGKCSMPGHNGKDCCKKDGTKMDCCKDGKCTMPGHDGKDCCKKDDAKMDCCKDGKCTMPGHDGKDCCKKS